MLLHITSRAEADAAQRSGTYEAAGYAREGFIHCSHTEQVLLVANQRFAGRQDLVLLEIDAERLPCAVVEENTEGGEELFPHIYGIIPWEAIERVHAFPCGEGGSFQLPSLLRSAASGPSTATARRNGP